MSVDAAYVLEQFQSELANVPEEVAHYLEEIKTKDIKLYNLRKRVQHNDSQIQKHIRAHGSLVENPKEASYITRISADLESAMKLQEEKCELANKLNDLMTRHLKRLDSEIKKLQNDGLLAPSTEQVVLSSIRAVTATPGHVQQMKRPSPQHPNGMPVVRGSTPDGSLPNTPGALQQRMMKKQKLGPGVSGLRTAAVTNSSPLTGLQMTPIYNSVAGNGIDTASMQFTGGAVERERSMPNMPNQHGPRLGGNRPGVKPKQKSAQQGGDDEEDDEENNDSALYCFCQQVSYGDMVACDNSECQYEWFHYGCVGLKQPPVGVWYCSAQCQEKAQHSNKRRK
ncbi:inhibitor of growth proteins N-terminal histone-binding-domain-containing protein [Lipomyces arxii]|uniref:inhibitor of growth proteins N-terminal histone-binding-domain-containing protein n=1 Tax=Lipomyces arxii TaxID=56418 RepID=UPI0034CE8BAB